MDESTDIIAQQPICRRPQHQLLQRVRTFQQVRVRDSVMLLVYRIEPLSAPSINPA
jgi:hypothetical protein